MKKTSKIDRNNSSQVSHGMLVPRDTLCVHKVIAAFDSSDIFRQGYVGYSVAFVSLLSDLPYFIRIRDRVA